MYVLESSCLALSEGEPVRLSEGDAVFIAQEEWHGVRNNTDQPAVTLVIYAEARNLEGAGYDEHLQQFDQHRYQSDGRRLNSSATVVTVPGGI
jgi:quercetin dioxygenase-like cupin family protein